jgi:hypothetical protein
MTSWGDGETDMQGHNLNDKAQLNQREGYTAELTGRGYGYTNRQGTQLIWQIRKMAKQLGMEMPEN